MIPFRKNPMGLTELETTLAQLIQSPMGRRKFLAAIPILMSSCAGPQKQLEKPQPEWESTLSVADEKIIAKEILFEMRRDYPPLRDTDIQRYISSLGAQLISKSKNLPDPYDYSFTVVDVPMVNAFALPAGTIFITAPLLDLVQSEAELAGVIGHEIGHVRCQHAARRIQAAKNEKSKSWWYGSGGALFGGMAGAAFASLVCPLGASSCANELIALGAGAGINGGLLIQKYKFLAHSRENELAADKIGFEVAVTAGFAPANVGDFYSRLQKIDETEKRAGYLENKSVNDALKTHPPSRERVNQMHQLCQNLEPLSNAIVSSVSFEKQKLRLTARLNSTIR